MFILSDNEIQKLLSFFGYNNLSKEPLELFFNKIINFNVKIPIIQIVDMDGNIIFNDTITYEKELEFWWLMKKNKKPSFYLIYNFQSFNYFSEVLSAIDWINDKTPIINIVYNHVRKAPLFSDLYETSCINYLRSKGIEFIKIMYEDDAYNYCSYYPKIYISEEFFKLPIKLQISNMPIKYNEDDNTFTIMYPKKKYYWN